MTGGWHTSEWIERPIVKYLDRYTRDCTSYEVYRYVWEFILDTGSISAGDTAAKDIADAVLSLLVEA